MTDLEANNGLLADAAVSDSDGDNAAVKSKTENATETKEESDPMASIGEVFSFGRGLRTRLCLAFGLMCSVVSGLVFPALAFYFATVFETLGASTSGDAFLANIRDMAFAFMILGSVAFVFMTLQSAFLETAASDMTFDLKTSWFRALLRQDLAYYDLMDVSSTASVISSNAIKYRRGVGRKLGEGLQFLVAVIGGFAYAFWASWQTSLVILTVVPVMSACSLAFMKVSQAQTSHAEKNYAEAGGVVYATVSAIRTVLSLNACDKMIQKFTAATERAYRAASRRLPWVGLCNGAVMGSFILGYAVLTLYGAYLLYSAVRTTGCDPSGGVPNNTTCAVSGVDVFGALMGISFGGMGLPQVSTSLEALTKARVACYPAIHAMKRKLGCEEDTVKPVVRKDEDRRESVVLPKYVIDSSSPDGLKPPDLKGSIEFRDVSFCYPSRPDSKVLDNFSLKVEAGKTVAIVGPSGGGKSTVTALIERFYDPTSGSITIDGHDVRSLNVQYLREQIGLVSQEPVLFATTIAKNIEYGRPNAKHEDIVEAARKANAHDFISAFPQGYETPAGDKGVQLSGGQKQRVAIARCLMKHPKILLLDEATSALDSESELLVQRALDDLLKKSNRTTIVIAHRLSTIRNADLIVFVSDGRVVETGSHDELMKKMDGRYRKLVDADQSRSTDLIPSEASQPAREDSIEVQSEGAEIVPSCSSDILDSACAKDLGRPQLELRDVTFSYPTRPDTVVFKGMDLTVYEGETLALVGPSGHGKSTTISLFERFYDPTSGSVELNGVSLRDINVKWLRDQLGLVSQEPTLFAATIAENIAYGNPDATEAQIEDAAKMANAHDFITSFPDGYQTQVGERGTQVSGGQKQRISIARAILKRPKVLILDEATSALDSKSEQVVQQALDRLMAQKNQTTVVIAHRLSTIRNADRIAVIADGKVKEVGTYDSLMEKPNGRFRRLTMLQNLKGMDYQRLLQQADEIGNEEKKGDELDAENVEALNETIDDDKSEEVNARRARMMAKGDAPYLAVGSFGACLAGLVFPGWGIMFAYMIRLLFQPVYSCDQGDPSCQAYYDEVAMDMRTMSFKLSFGWLGVIGATVFGNMLLFFGFGTASEKMNMRVRNSAFQSLVRQEVGFFDRSTVGSITSQLQEDAALLHSFSGEPIRVLVMNLASLLVGLVVSFLYMWPFALLTLGVLPFMGIGSYLEMQMWSDQVAPEEKVKDDENSPGGVVMESLLNIRTIASLSIENNRYLDYVRALKAENRSVLKSNFLKGSTYGLSQFIQNWGMALMFWWGGWLLANYPTLYTFEDFLISMFSLLFSLSGTAVAAQGVTDKKKAAAAAQRIFYLIDRKSAIDPLSDEGKKDV